MSFHDFIKQQIQHSGPMDVGTFMGLAVGHYYANEQPFGKDGDFITAPEVSQMFGELLGAWAADCWMQMGQPPHFQLIECGPGRGTLMADALRATKAVPGFHDAAEIILIENSEALRAKQKMTLHAYDIEWADSFDDAVIQSSKHPVILLANEFLDALPVRQFQYKGGKWQERVIGVDGSDYVHFGLAEAPPALTPQHGGLDGDICEVSPACQGFVQKLCDVLAQRGGAGLFIDYGYNGGHGDTLQAVKNHEYVDVLETIGEADITAHVDFAALAKCAGECQVSGPVTQGEFLAGLGIAQRAAVLQQNAKPKQVAAVEAALKRLTGPKDMGELFKVIGFSGGDIRPAGF